MTDLLRGLLGEGHGMVAVITILGALALMTLIYVCCGSRQQSTGHPSESKADLFEHDYAQWLRRHPTGRGDNQPQPGNYGITEATAEKIRAGVRREIGR